MKARVGAFAPGARHGSPSRPRESRFPGGARAAGGLSAFATPAILVLALAFASLSCVPRKAAYVRDPAFPLAFPRADLAIREEMSRAGLSPVVLDPDMAGLPSSLVTALAKNRTSVVALTPLFLPSRDRLVTAFPERTFAFPCSSPDDTDYLPAWEKLGAEMGKEQASLGKNGVMAAVFLADGAGDARKEAFLRGFRGAAGEKGIGKLELRSVAGISTEVETALKDLLVSDIRSVALYLADFTGLAFDILPARGCAVSGEGLEPFAGARDSVYRIIAPDWNLLARRDLARALGEARERGKRLSKPGKDSRNPQNADFAKNSTESIPRSSAIPAKITRTAKPR